MTRDELLDLAARVEAATGPDRALDADIELVLHPELVVLPWARVNFQCGKAPYYEDTSDPDALNVVFPAVYTRSLDAALTLVPAELWWRVSVVAGRPSANVRTGSIISPGTKEWEGHAATPALALTAAALRARAEEAGDV